MTELKPCPFCGGKADRLYLYYGQYTDKCFVKFRLGCKKCNISQQEYIVHLRLSENLELEVEQDKIDAAIEAWNRRVNE